MEPAYTRMELDPKCAGSIGSRSVIVIAASTATPIEPYTGLKLRTVGAVVSGRAEADVVKVVLNGAIMLPDKSRAPTRVRPYVLDGARLAAGMNRMDTRSA